MPPGTQPISIIPLIRTIRGHRVILDHDLAGLYGVSTTRLNQQVRRNRRRFPPDFAFPLTRREHSSMLLQFATASKTRNRGKPPAAYTEYGAVMAANVLRSERAILMSVEVVRAFIRFRKAVVSWGRLSRKVAQLERAVASRLDRHDKDIGTLFRTVQALLGNAVVETKNRIGFVPG